jgi:hypothetical protein
MSLKTTKTTTDVVWSIDWTSRDGSPCRVSTESIENTLDQTAEYAQYHPASTKFRLSKTTTITQPIATLTRQALSKQQKGAS